MSLDAKSQYYEVLIFISKGYPSVKGKFYTRYAPVRRSSASASTPVTPRLACVKPAASVHPEPGSNSSLYILIIWMNKFQKNLTSEEVMVILLFVYAVNFNIFNELLVLKISKQMPKNILY